MLIPVSKKSDFAPIRFQATRPWWKTMGKLAAKSEGFSFKKQSQFLQKELQPTAFKTIREMIGVRDPRILQNESGLIQIFGGFIASGRVIYEIAESLTDSLAITDLDDTTLEDMDITKGNVYLHFGDHPFLNIDGIQYEGMFVKLLTDYLEGEKLLSIQVVRAGAFSKKPIHYSNNDNVESLPIFFNSDQQTLSSAIESSRNRLEQQNKDALMQLEQIKSMLEGQGMDPDLSAAMMGIGTLPSEDLYKKVTSVALSALCFLTARPEDVIETWPSDAPKDLVERATSSKDAGKRSGAERGLENEGYLQVNYVGNQYALSSETVRYFKKGDSAEDIKRVVATHPRRGFFKRQPHGPKFSERKIIYIAPTIVNPGGSKLGSGKVIKVKENP